MFTFQHVSEEALLLRFKGENLPDKNAKVRQFCDWAQAGKNRPSWLIELVPSYDTVMIVYEWNQVDPFTVSEWTTRFQPEKVVFSAQNEVVIPVCYQLAEENDRERIATHNRISIEQAIHHHSKTKYRVFAIGFSPGFAYLGECPSEIETPRLDSVRKHVPAGAVAIADRQTAIYPMASPGGWNIIGHCPLTTVDYQSPSLSPFKVGDTVTFSPISTKQYAALKGKLWHEPGA